jgi:hypothetical protein
VAEAPTKLHIHGSVLSRDMAGTVRDRATVIAVARNLSNDGSNSSLPQAITSLLNAAGATYQPEQNPPLPLKLITAMMTEDIHGTKAIARLEYGRNRIPVNTNKAAGLQVPMVPSTYISWWFNSNSSYDAVTGLPNGPVLVRDGWPVRWKWIRPAYRAFLPIKLSFNPFSVIYTYQGTANNGTVHIGGHSIPANQVRFDAFARITPTFFPNGAEEWIGAYQFTLVPAGLVSQKFTGSFDVGGIPIIETVNDCQQKNFLSPGFPTHSGNGLA